MWFVGRPAEGEARGARLAFGFCVKEGMRGGSRGKGRRSRGSGKNIFAKSSSHEEAVSY